MYHEYQCDWLYQDPVLRELYCTRKILKTNGPPVVTQAPR